jgi:hypothetical protein
MGAMLVAFSVTPLGKADLRPGVSDALHAKVEHIERRLAE